MTYRELYRQAYRILNDTTPLEVDCGQLCGARCCQSEGEEESGMYLFPGEEVMFHGAGDWVRIEDSDFVSGRKTCADFVLSATLSERTSSAGVPYFSAGALFQKRDA